jgi:hypothetical protein
MSGLAEKIFSRQNYTDLWNAYLADEVKWWSDHFEFGRSFTGECISKSAASPFRWGLFRFAIRLRGMVLRSPSTDQLELLKFNFTRLRLELFERAWRSKGRFQSQTLIGAIQKSRRRSFYSERFVNSQASTDRHSVYRQRNGSENRRESKTANSSNLWQVYGWFRRIPECHVNWSLPGLPPSQRGR